MLIVINVNAIKRVKMKLLSFAIFFAITCNVYCTTTPSTTTILTGSTPLTTPVPSTTTSLTTTTASSTTTNVPELTALLCQLLREILSNTCRDRPGVQPPFERPGRPPFGRPPFGRPPSGRPPFGRPPSGRPPFGRPPFGRVQSDRSPLNRHSNSFCRRLINLTEQICPAQQNRKNVQKSETHMNRARSAKKHAKYEV